MEAPTQTRWLTRVELAERLQMSTQTLAGWATQGRGPRFAKFGSKVRYALEDVISWEQDQITRD